MRLLSSMGVGCDVIAPSLVPVGAGDRVKTDRRDAKKLVRLFRAGELVFVDPPDRQTEGLRDLMRCRDDLRCARTAARHRVAKQLLRHGRIYREGKKAWTQRHYAWVRRQRLEDRLAQIALDQMLCHLDGLDRQLAHLDAELDQIAAQEPWAERVAALTAFRGIATRTALGLIAEIGDFRRFGHPRELASWLGITPTEYSSGDSQHPRPNHQSRPTVTPAGCSSKPPGTTVTHHGAPTTAPSHQTAPGRHRSACTAATVTSSPAANARPSSTSRSPASWRRSSGPR